MYKVITFILAIYIVFCHYLINNYEKINDDLIQSIDKLMYVCTESSTEDLNNERTPYF